MSVFIRVSYIIIACVLYYSAWKEIGWRLTKQNRAINLWWMNVDFLRPSKDVSGTAVSMNTNAGKTVVTVDVPDDCVQVDIEVSKMAALALDSAMVEALRAGIPCEVPLVRFSVQKRDCYVVREREIQGVPIRPLGFEEDKPKEARNLRALSYLFFLIAVFLFFRHTIISAFFMSGAFFLFWGNVPFLSDEECLKLCVVRKNAVSQSGVQGPEPNEGANGAAAGSAFLSEILAKYEKPEKQAQESVAQQSAPQPVQPEAKEESGEPARTQAQPCNVGRETRAEPECRSETEERTDPAEAAKNNGFGRTFQRKKFAGGKKPKDQQGAAADSIPINDNAAASEEEEEDEVIVVPSEQIVVQEKRRDNSAVRKTAERLFVREH